MTQFRHGKLTEVMLADMIASPYLNSASVSKTMEAAETSAFGTQDKTYIVGQNDGTVSLGGLFDGTPDAIDEKFDSLTAIEGNYPASLFYDGGIKVGRSTRSAQVKQTSYDITSPIGDVVGLSVELQCNGGVHSGFSLTDNLGVNASTAYGGVDWGANSASDRGGTAYIHVPHNTRNVATQVVIQHSSDNSVWVDLATQPVSSATVGHYVLDTGPVTVDRYVRANLTLTTGTGLVNVIVAFARN